MPKGSRIRETAIIIPENTTASSKAREIASKGSKDSTASKKPVDMHQGGTRTRKNTVPRIRRGFIRLVKIVKIPQKKEERKSRITIRPFLGRMERAHEYKRTVNPKTQIRAPAQIRAKESRFDAIIIRAAPLSADSGEWKPQKR
jgi:hypothetical protein